MQLPVVDGLPVVPGAVDVSAQQGGLFIAYGDWVKGTGTKRMRGPDQVIAYLWEAKPGLYAVFADETKLPTIDPLGTGKPMSEWKKTDLAQWPDKPGWRKVDENGDLTAEPTVPSSCGPDNLVDNLDTAKEITP
jgi:hypothetical protein